MSYLKYSKYSHLLFCGRPCYIQGLVPNFNSLKIDKHKGTLGTDKYKTQQVCFSVQRVRGSIPGLGRLVKITICCVEPPLGVTLSPAGSLANSCYPATWGRPVWRRQPFATRVAIPPFFDMDSIHRLWDSNLRPVCQRLEFHTHTYFEEKNQ